MDLFNQTDQLSSQEVFHASRFQLQEQEKAQRMIDISGRKCLELSKKSARTTLLGRMCLDYLVLKGEWYLNRCALTWKAKATKSKRLYFQLVPQVHRTEGIESGLLLTPTRCEEVQDLDQFQKRMEKYPNGTKIPNLATQIQGLLPTPSKSDTEGGVTQTVSERNGRFIRTSDTTGTEYGAKLRDAIGLLKTPGAQDAMMENMTSKGVSGTSGNLAQEAKNGILAGRMGLYPTPTKSESIDVPRQVVMKGNSPRIQSNQGVDGQAKLVDMLASGLIPTPASRDIKGANSQEHMEKNPDRVNHIDQLPNYIQVTTGTTGHLSHRFTLDMMGFPPNWCDISEPILQRLEKRLKTLKRTSGKNQIGLENKQ